MKYAISIANRLLDKIVLIIGLCLLLVGGYGIYDNYMVFYNASDESLLKIKEYFEDDAEDNPPLLDNNIGWLTIDGTTVDYPLMQGCDNYEFLNKDPYGKYSLSGSIFLDFRNKPDMTDGYNLIYGHHMAAGAMFGALDEYHKKGYLSDHDTGTLITKAGMRYKLLFFAVLESDASDRIIFDLDTRPDIDMVTYARTKAEYYLEGNAKGKGRILALSTCRYPDTTDRTVIIAKLHEDDI